MREDIEILLSFSNMVDRITNGDVIRQNKEEIITNFLKSYYADMYEVEKLHIGDKYENADMNYLIDLKRKIFEVSCFCRVTFSKIIIYYFLKTFVKAQKL